MLLLIVLSLPLQRLHPRPAHNDARADEPLLRPPCLVMANRLLFCSFGRKLQDVSHMYHTSSVSLSHAVSWTTIHRCRIKELRLAFFSLVFLGARVAKVMQ